MFLRLLLESFLRQRRRKLLAGLAILLGTTAVTAMLALATSIGDRIHAELAVYGANIVVTPKAADLDVKIGSTDIHPATGNALLHESDLDKLHGIFWANNITGLSPELAFTLPIQGHPIPSLGLWFDHTFGPLHTGAPQLHPWWKLSGSWPGAPAPGQPTQAVLGATLARTLAIRPGDTLSLQQPRPAALLITGIVSTGDATDNRILIPLASAQQLASLPNAISRVDISARTRPEDTFARQDPDSLSPKQRDIWYCRPYANSIAYQIREAIPNADAQQVRQVEQSEGSVLSRISGLMWLISLAALLSAAFAVSAAMATAILERQSEIGLMRSLGASRAAIALLFYSETALLAAIAGILGYLLGSILAALLGNRIFSPLASTGTSSAHLTLATTFNPVLLPVILALALTVAIVGSTPAIRQSLRLDPSAILRASA